MKHKDLALSIARAMMRRLPAGVLREDIEQAALIGLWKALNKTPSEEFSPEQERAYIARRIRGSIFDELRRQDWAPRRGRAHGEFCPTVVRFDDMSVDGLPFVERLQGASPDPEEQAIVRFDSTRALEAPLIPADREAVTRTVLHGEQQNDAAGAMCTSPARVNQRTHRALNVMRAWLDGEVDLSESVPVRIPREAHLQILEAHEDRNRRRPDRATGTDPRAAAPERAHCSAVRGDRLGRPPAARADRQMPAGACSRAGFSAGKVGGVCATSSRWGAHLTPQQKEIVVRNAQRVALRVRSDIARLRAQGFDSLEIAAELGLERDVVEKILTEPAPLRKCGP